MTSCLLLACASSASPPLSSSPLLLLALLSLAVTKGEIFQLRQTTDSSHQGEKEGGEEEMKRTLDSNEDPAVDAEKTKKRKGDLEEEQHQETGFVHLDEDLIFEVFKHVDARSLATAACVNKQWYKTAQDERLWEMICTRHWANTGCGSQQLRSVVLALGGFRRLHSHCLWPLLKPPSLSSPSPLPTSSSLSSSSPSSSSSTSSSSLPPALPSPALPTKSPIHWGKDEVQLSLSLLSIRYFEKMNVNNRGGR